MKNAPTSLHRRTGVAPVSDLLIPLSLQQKPQCGNVGPRAGTHCSRISLICPVRPIHSPFRPNLTLFNPTSLNSNQIQADSNQKMKSFGPACSLSFVKESVSIAVHLWLKTSNLMKLNQGYFDEKKSQIFPPTFGANHWKTMPKRSKKRCKMGQKTRNL
jgi:hypothetical protein